MNHYRRLLSDQLLGTEEVQRFFKSLRVHATVAAMQQLQQAREETQAAAHAQLAITMRQWEQERIEESIVKTATQKQYISALATGCMPKRPRPTLVTGHPDLGEVG